MKTYLTAFLILALTFTGCVTTEVVPKDYTGPTAIVRDSGDRVDQTQISFFYVEKVDDQKIHNILIESRQLSAGNGFNLTMGRTEREVPIKQMDFEIVGRTSYAAPIQALTSKVYEVRGNITFTPEPEKVYVVKGVLGPDYCSVWLEELATGQVVGKKIESEGDSSLGILEK